MTQKTSTQPEERAVKEIFYRLHDCLHQLWGVPTPATFSEEERCYYKRCQMAGEIAVLAITEFCYGLLMKTAFPELQTVIDNRLATQIFPWASLNRPRLHEVVTWLDTELHECEGRPVPKNHEAFVIDYRAMLQRDRDMIDINWKVMKDVGWHPGENAPKDMLPPGLQGLDLSLWMVDDFIRLLGTSAEVDWALREFNRERRSKVVLPEGWAS